jgi:hypothetical protein
MNDATSSAGGAPDQWINCGANIVLTGTILDKNPNATSTTRFITNSNSPTNCKVTVTATVITEG